MEDRGTESDVDYNSLLQRERILGSGLENVLVIFWRRMWLLSALVQNNLPGSKLKRFGLMELAEISRQPSIDSVEWLLTVTFMQICNEKEQAEKEKK